MRQSEPRFDFRRCLNPIALATVIVGITGLAAVMFTMFETSAHATQERVAEWLLGSILALYWALLFMAVVGGPILTFLVVRARRAGVKRPAGARLLLLSLSSLLGLILIETVSAVWLSWAHRFPNLPVRLSNSPGNELRIAVIGGSSARGQPYQDWLSIGPIVAWKLQPALSGRRVIADVLAREGATLEEMHQKLGSIHRRPDILIIFAGHNEFQARFPWDQDGDSPPGFLPFALEVVMKDGLGSPFFRCVGEALQKFRLMSPPRMVERGPVEPPIVRRAEYEHILADFGRRLEAIVSWCDRIGTVPVLVIPPGNESGYEPNRSLLPASVSPAERLAFAKAWQAARTAETDPVQAMANYRVLIARQPGFAEAHFRLARLLEQLGHDSEAECEYRLAQDLDGFPQRCQTSFQECYRKVAARHHCILIDGPAELRTKSPNGIVGDPLINDAHHPSLWGHILLAEAVLRELRGREVLGWSYGTAPAIDVAECASRFGIDRPAWATICGKIANFYTITAIIRHDPSERRRKAELFHSAEIQIARGTIPSALGIPGVGVPTPLEPGQPLGDVHARETTEGFAPWESTPGRSESTRAPERFGQADQATAATKALPMSKVGSPRMCSTHVR